MSTLTTNYGFILPGVNDPADQDLWGGYLNSNWSSIDTLLKDASGFTTVARTTTYQLLDSDGNKMFLCDATAGTFTMTLPAAATAGNGFIVVIKKIDAGGNAVTIEGSGAETIDSAANYTLAAQGDSVYLVCNGSAWFIAAYKVASPSGVPDATTSTKGIVQLATDAEAIAGVNTTKAIVPSSLAAALADFETEIPGLPTVTAGSTGKIVIGAVTIQWGTVSGPSSSAYGSAFSGTPYRVIATPTNAARSSDGNSITSLKYTVSGSSTSITIAGNASETPANFDYIVIGPT